MIITGSDYDMGVKSTPPYFVHVVPGISQESSGPSYSVVRLCDELANDGRRVTLATVDWGKPVHGREFMCTFPLGAGPRRLGRSPALLAWLRAAARDNGGVTLHAHGMWQINALYPARTAIEFGCHLVMSPRGALSEWAMSHGSLLKKPFWWLFQREALEAVTCFHATSEAEYLEIRRLGFSQPVAVIPNGIDTPARVGDDESRKPELLFLGRLHPKKGVELLLHAWRELQSAFPQWRLVVAGSDSGYHRSSGYAASLQRLSRTLGLERTDFVGELLGDAKRDALSSAEVFVLPTRSENFGIAVAEALACGTPAVVTKGAPWSGLEAERAGWWCDASVPALREALVSAMSLTPSRRRLMGRSARAWMERDFGWPSIARRIGQVYDWLNDRSSSPPTSVLLD